MIRFQTALKRVLSETAVLSSTRMRLQDSLGYYLASGIRAPFDMPRFDNSAVDGYGVRVRDVARASNGSPAALDLADTARAGSLQLPELSPGTTVKIFTGAPVPRGVEAVIMREWTDEDTTVRIKRAAKPGENIRWQGEEFRKGTEVIPKGTQITPAVIGLLSAFGLTSCQVYRKPMIRIITVGDELISPGKALRGSRIYDSTGPALLAWCKGLRIPDVRTRRARDNRQSLEKNLDKMVPEADVIITVGGVSVGDYDITKKVFEDRGVRRCYWRVAMKPGLPNYFGTLKLPGQRKTLFFGLPGNPVSALLAFHLLVKPALVKSMSGREPVSAHFSAKLTSALRKKVGRLEFVRGYAEAKDGQWIVTPVRGQQSHMMGGLTRANCLIYFDAESSHLAPGSRVEIELLTYS